jgi:beta-glucosidase/6-phospho-beta-glucosidase/beta-galactosidase
MENDFFFGAATSSHQVEGNNRNDWSGWERANAARLAGVSKKYPEENYISGRACDHYHRFREDFDITKSLGHNAHRFSVEWSRIEPEEGKFDACEIGGFVNDLLVQLADKLRNFRFLDRIRRESDFIGFNYYFHNRVDGGFNKNKNDAVSDMGWEICPEGIYHVLKKLKKYHLPIYITENGLADAYDLQRASFITQHISWMQKAMDEGVDVRGYFHWSLLDNFEWDKGFWPRFGLVAVDYQTLERTIRPSALVYKKIVDSWHAK